MKSLRKSKKNHSVNAKIDEFLKEIDDFRRKSMKSLRKSMKNQRVNAKIDEFPKEIDDFRRKIDEILKEINEKSKRQRENR